MRQKYKELRFRADTLAVIDQANEILDEYADADLVVTLRQLYYQFVSRDLMANTVQNYKRLGSIVSDGRMAGLIDWSRIEDRGRVPEMPSQWPSAASLARAAANAFRLPRWNGQRSYVEVWIEKQALVGVLAPLADELHVTLMANKGYSSQSAMRDAALRYQRNIEVMGRMVGKPVQPCLAYLGDHDPSGNDMVRDIRERMELFGVRGLLVDRLALTREQINEHQPPPNPAKVTDSRFEAYRREHGDYSWELDALDPPLLQSIVRDWVVGRRDDRTYRMMLRDEDRQRSALEDAAARMEDD